jgi:peroxiredoxin
MNYLFIALMLCISTVLAAETKSMTSLPVSKMQQTQIRPAQSFTAKTIDGKSIQLSSYRGKVILINYWATWCPPCVAEIPDLVKLQKKYGSNIQIIGISLDDNVAPVTQFMAKKKLNYPVIMADDSLKALYTPIAAIPTTVVINKDMMITQIETGFHKREYFDAIISRLLK